jgi:hypothetical protein
MMHGQQNIKNVVPLLTSCMLSKLQLILYGTEVMKLDSTLRQDEDDSNIVADIRHLVHYYKICETLQ